MNLLARLEVPAFALLIVVVAYACAGLAPQSPLLHPLQPPYFATLAAMGVTASLLLLRRLPRRRLSLERLTLALFLSGMPLIYVWAAWLANDAAGMDLELFGLPVFAGLAWWGYRHSTAILGAGILAHGIAWDAWHHGHSAYMPDWYALGCLLVDVALGLLVFTQWPAHFAARTDSDSR